MRRINMRNGATGEENRSKERGLEDEAEAPAERAEAMLRKGLTVLGLVAMLGPLTPRAWPARRILDRIIARVNNEIITQIQFEREKQRIRAQLAQDYSGPELEQQVREQTKNLLRDMIDQDLMVQRGKDLDIEVEIEVVKRLDEIRQNFHAATLEDLQKQVEDQGLVWEDFKDNIRRSLLMRQVIEREVGGRLIISREDERKYFEAHKQDFASPPGVHLAEILVSPEKRSPEEAEKRAKDVLAELKAGARWNDAVKKYSDDTASVKEGGDVGFFKSGTLAPEINAAVAKVETNDFSDVVKTKAGYMIFKVLELRSGGTPTFEEVEPRVNEALYEDKIQAGLRDYLTTLRKESYIYLAPGYVDTGAERVSETALAKKGQ